MPKYDTVQFSPPAPIGAIELRNPATGGVQANVPMLLDNGADVTLIPRKYVSQLQIPIDPAQVHELIGFDSARSTAVAVHLDLIFLGQTFRGRFLLIDQPDGVLGRNVLNHLNLALNGPKSLWDKIR
jgi:Aspartyl protease